MRVEFTVHGVPQPQGSSKAFVARSLNRAIITSANAKLRPWRQDVSLLAKEAMLLASLHGAPTKEAIAITCEFFFIKPKSTKRSVTQKITKPDVDKALRGILDALTGIVFHDDSQVIEAHAYKAFADAPHARIVVESR